MEGIIGFVGWVIGCGCGDWWVFECVWVWVVEGGVIMFWNCSWLLWGRRRSGVKRWDVVCVVDLVSVVWVWRVFIDWVMVNCGVFIVGSVGGVYVWWCWIVVEFSGVRVIWKFYWMLDFGVYYFRDREWCWGFNIIYICDVIVVVFSCISCEMWFDIFWFLRWWCRIWVWIWMRNLIYYLCFGIFSFSFIFGFGIWI